MSIFTGIIGVIVSLFQIFLSKKPRTKTRVLEVFLLNYLVFIVGLTGLMAFYAHAFMAAQTAESIGWAPGSPFQFEIAGANLAVGVGGILCIWFRDKFWLATIIINGILLEVAAYGHIQQIIVAHDYAPNNAGMVLYTDIIAPIVGIILYILYRRAQKEATV